MLHAALALPALARAQPTPGRAELRTELRIVLPEDGAATRRVLEALRERHPNAVAAQDVMVLAARPGPALYIAPGPASLAAALAGGVRGALVSLFTSRTEYERILANAPRGRGVTTGITAIYAEASPASQMRLVAALYRRRVSVLALLSRATTGLEKTLRDAATAAGLTLVVEDVAPDENVLRVINAAAPFAALLTLPDRAIYTQENLRAVLESTYRRGRAVIGFSTGMVTAGTLAAAYASIEDTLAHFDELLPALEAGRVPEAQYPRYWRVALNENVARSLGIVIDQEVSGLGARPPGGR